jgi:hypothetical protein
MRLEQQELEMAEVRSDLSARDLWEVENYFRKTRCVGVPLRRAD